MTRETFEEYYVETIGENSIIGFIDSEKFKKISENIIFFEFNVKPGDKVKKGETLISMEVMKGNFEIIAYFDFEVSEVNKSVEQNPEILATEPETWLLKIKK